MSADKPKGIMSEHASLVQRISTETSEEQLKQQLDKHQQFTGLMAPTVNPPPLHHLLKGALIAAAGGCHLPLINRLLELGANEMPTISSNTVNVSLALPPPTPLTAAARNGHLEACKLLLATGNIASADIGAAIYGAAAGNHLEVVKELPKDGGREVFFALEVAVKSGYLEVVKELSKHEKDLNWGLSLAKAYGHTEISQWLIDQGAIESTDPNYLAWVLEAIVPDVDMQTIRRMIETADISNFEVVTTKAAKVGRLDALKELIQAKGSSAGNALIAAAGNGQTEVVEWLFSQQLPGLNDQAILDNALTAAAKGNHYTEVWMLLRNGANSSTGALLGAIANDDVDSLHELLFSSGGDILTAALTTAASNNSLETIAWLRNVESSMRLAAHRPPAPARSKMSDTIYGKAALTKALLAAAKEGHLTAAKELITAGAVVDNSVVKAAIANNHLDCGLELALTMRSLTE